MPLMSHLSPLPLSDMALCQGLLKEQHVTCFICPHFHPSDQRLAVALTAPEGEQREGWTIGCPFSSLSLCFILSLLLCAQSAILSMRRSACCAYLSNTTQQWQWHCFLWEGLTVYVTEQWTNGPTGRTFPQPHLQTHSHMRTCMSNDVARLGDL